MVATARRRERAGESWVALGTFAGVALALALAPAPAAAQSLADRVPALAPKIEAYVAGGMKSFDLPGVVMAIVADDKVVFTKALGVRAKSDPRPVDGKTLFQIGSATKGFLATALAMAVDKKLLHWDDAIAALEPAFALKDPWVTREMRVFDIIAQRSGLTPYAHDFMAFFGYSDDALVASLRYAEPITSFRSSFAYTNITHLIAGRILAARHKAAGWPQVAKAELIDPLGMSATSFTAQAIADAANHATGHRFDAGGSVEVPFDPAFPYRLGPAGDINSNLEDMTRWLRFQLAGGELEGKRLVSKESLAVTRMARVPMSQTSTYDMGWVTTQSPNGRIIWHNGGTLGFGAHIGFLPDRNIGVVVLSNAQNNGFPDAIAMWTYDRLLGNPEVDYIAAELTRAKAAQTVDTERYQRPKDARPAGDLSALVGRYRSPAMGAASLRLDGERLVLALEATGAELRLDLFDGLVFSAFLVPKDRFANIVKLNGDVPFGFAQFTADGQGRFTTLTLSIEEQTTPFRKD